MIEKQILYRLKLRKHRSYGFAKGLYFKTAAVKRERLSISVVTSALQIRVKISQIPIMCLTC